MTLNSPIRFAIVGCGAVAKKHFTALASLSDVEITSICDVDLLTAQRTGEELGVPWFTGPQEMLKAIPCDVISILTPTGNHPDIVCALAPFGKPMVVEKPMALQIDDADRMIETCQKYGCPLFVVKQNRFNPPITLLKYTIDSGRFGKLVMGSVRVWWSRSQEYYDAGNWRGTLQDDGGVLANQAAHHIDMLIWLMGDVESVSATTATRLANIEAEDTAAAVMRFKNGAIGVIEATTGTRPKDIEGSIAILGEHGNAEVGGFFMNELKRWEFAHKEDGDKQVFRDFGSVPKIPAWNLSRYLEHVVECVRQNLPALVDGAEGRKTTQLVNAIWKSAKTGQTVKLTNEAPKIF